MAATKGTHAPKRTRRKPVRPTTVPQVPNITTAPDGYLTRQQSAAFCGGINLQIIDSTIRRGQLHAHKVQGRDVKPKGSVTKHTGEPRRVLIRKTDLIAWVESQQV